MINQSSDFYIEKKRRRNEEFKFFGVKRFISVYAKKPRIKIKAYVEKKLTPDLLRNTGYDSLGSRAAISGLLGGSFDGRANYMAQMQSQFCNQQMGMMQAQAFGQASAQGQARLGFGFGVGQAAIGNIFGLGG